MFVILNAVRCVSAWSQEHNVVINSCSCEFSPTPWLVTLMVSNLYRCLFVNPYSLPMQGCFVQCSGGYCFVALRRLNIRTIRNKITCTLLQNERRSHSQPRWDLLLSHRFSPLPASTRPFDPKSNVQLTPVQQITLRLCPVSLPVLAGKLLGICAWIYCAHFSEFSSKRELFDFSGDKFEPSEMGGCCCLNWAEPDAMYCDGQKLESLSRRRRDMRLN